MESDNIWNCTQLDQKHLTATTICVIWIHNNEKQIIWKLEYTSAVHMRDQRFSKQPQTRFPLSRKKTPLNENFVWFSSQIYP